MTVWRYTAVPSAEADAPVRRGSLAADSPSEVRAALRRVGLQVIDMRPARRRGTAGGRRGARAMIEVWNRHSRARRRPVVAEFYDSLATMLGAGEPLLGALSTVSGDADAGAGRRHTMLAELRERLRAGAALADAMSEHPAWFGPVEIAMIRAGQHAGELGATLRTLAERSERSNEITNKLSSALAYPAVVCAVGVGVVIFLSTKTLPELVAILDDAGVAPPTLTMVVMGVGRSIVASWWVYVGGAVLGLATCAALFARDRAEPLTAPAWAHRAIPRVLRRAAVAEIMMGLAELVRTGVPMVESLRVLAPTCSGPGGSFLRPVLENAADRIEHGESLAAALDHPGWFSRELRRLLEVGESSGELPDILDRIGQRQRRAATKAIDRFASMLEPAVILLLAVLVGVVVLSAVLPLVRLQEVLG